MARVSCSLLSAFVGCCFVSVLLVVPATVTAHCDTYAGPVITEAKQAFEKGDVTLLLKWVKKEDEEQIKTTFKKALAVRTKSAEAKDIADQFFFETLVRIHRAGEGAPFTGLKSGPIEPIEAMADKALETGNVDSLAAKIAAHVKQGIKERYAKAFQARKSADKSVESGREYVEAYVTYLHYVIGIHSAIMAKSGHTDGMEAGDSKHKD